MRKLVYGVGVNDAAYQVSRNACRNGVAWVCPKYSLWKAMLQRGYSEKFKAKNPAYIERRRSRLAEDIRNSRVTVRL